MGVKRLLWKSEEDERIISFYLFWIWQYISRNEEYREAYSVFSRMQSGEEFDQKTVEWAQDLVKLFEY